MKGLQELLMEAVVLDVNIGDTIYVGRFKNKPIEVKEIGTDDHGMPTINGRKVVNFRFAKKQVNEENMNKEYTIFCDMDGVLCNFEAFFEELTGYEYEGFEDKYGSAAF